MKNNIPDIFQSATFDEIKTVLIDWLRNQDEFKDYDFEGSRLNVLVDLLAYNTLYIQQFSNAALFESFIRTAALRSSVVQHAQDMGYLPDSKTASSTTLFITAVNPLNPTTIKIPRGTKFVASVENTNSYTFVTLDDVIIVRGTDNTYQTMVNVSQGRLVRTQLSYDPKKPVLIYDKNIDRNEVSVWVNDTKWLDWTNNSMVNATGSSSIFYQRETIDGFTEIYFGEGVVDKFTAGGSDNEMYVGGLKPNVGATIVVEYLNTKGEEANGCRNFAYVDTSQNISITNIVENPTNSQDYTGTSGGGDPEDIERIRELAPVMRETQERCVTASDYESFVSRRFGSIVQAVQCFNDSDKPGYAFIAVKPKQGLRLTSVQKEDIKTYLSAYNLATITPSILDPNYLYVKQDVKVTYNLSELDNSEEWLKGKVIDAIDRYYINEVEIFNKSFSKSKMLTNVDSVHDSIIGSSAELGLVREIDNFYKAPMSGITFLNMVESESVISSTFDFTKGGRTYKVRYASTAKDQNGVAKLVVGPFIPGDISIQEYTNSDFKKYTDGTAEQTMYYEVGEVQHIEDFVYYDLGVLNQTSSAFTGTYIELHATPVAQNIFTGDGSLIVFENELRPQYTTITLEHISH